LTLPLRGPSIGTGSIVSDGRRFAGDRQIRGLPDRRLAMKGRAVRLASAFLLVSLCLVLVVHANPHPSYMAAADLDGTHVVPPTSSTGLGTFELWFPVEGDPPDVCVYYWGLADSVTGVTICRGMEGFNGPVAYTPYAGYFASGVCASMPELNWNEEDFAEIDSLQLYVVIHTRAYPDGEIRGQLQQRSFPTRSMSVGEVKQRFE